MGHDFISEHAIQKNSIQAWVICIVGSLYTLYMFLQTAKVNAIASYLMADFKINSVGLGLLSSMYFWGNIAFLFPAGLLVDRLSIKRLLATAFSVDVLCNIAFSHTRSFVVALACFTISGASGAFTLLLPLRLASNWFTSNKMALVSGVIITSGFIGYLVSQTPLALLTGAVGWRAAMKCNAILGWVFLIISLFIIRDAPERANPKTPYQQASNTTSSWNSLKEVIRNRQNWLFGLYTNLINLPVLIFGAVFGVRYVEQASKVTEGRASFATLLLFLGATIGSPSFGWLSDRMRLRKPPMYLGGAISLALVMLLIYTNPTYYVLCIVFFALGFFTSSQVITYPAIIESNKTENTGASLGMGSILIMSGGAIFVPLFGWLLDWGWDGKMINNLPWYTINNYHLALWLLPIAIIAAVISVALSKETININNNASSVIEKQ